MDTNDLESTEATQHQELQPTLHPAKPRCSPIIPIALGIFVFGAIANVAYALSQVPTVPPPITPAPSSLRVKTESELEIDWQAVKEKLSAPSTCE